MLSDQIIFNKGPSLIARNIVSSESVDTSPYPDQNIKKDSIKLDNDEINYQKIEKKENALKTLHTLEIPKTLSVDRRKPTGILRKVKTTKDENKSLQFVIPKRHISDQSKQSNQSMTMFNIRDIKEKSVQNQERMQSNTL